MIKVEVRDEEHQLGIAVTFDRAALDDAPLMGKAMRIVGASLDRAHAMQVCDDEGHDLTTNEQLLVIWDWYCLRCNAHGDVVQLDGRGERVSA